KEVANRNNYEAKIDGYGKQIQEALTRFEQSLQTEEARKNVLQLKSLIEKMGPIQQKAISLAYANREDEAFEVLASEGQALTDEINSLVDNLFALKNTSGRELSEQYTVSGERAVFTMISISIIAMIIAGLLGFFISRMISKPLIKLVVTAEQIADGNLNTEIDNDTKDEIGILAGAFNRMVDNLNEVMNNISSASEQVASGAKQLSDSSISLSQGATEQASSVEELTASLEEIASQTNTNAENANQVNRLAETAKLSAAQGNKQMKEMLLAMDEINDSSSNISKIIKVIDEIAFQTNILALNAAVEAARAGQHGKGFAVVAEEVRNLAARSANAAKETTAMIEGSIKKVEAGTKIANQTAADLGEIVEGVAKVAKLVGDIAAASNEQAAGISQVNQGIIQVSEVIQTNSATSEESAAASEELASQAEVLQRQVSKFELKKFEKYNRYRGFEDIESEGNPMFSSIGEKKKTVYSKEPYQNKVIKSKQITLSDKEFGKY
ncbi:MAG: methyl-accepting chemotaxis sensory transducer, partial [Clostridia bacterium]|nr:methyl-accepting chemotaxis sensory transducer [Clostridia bacterium]